MTANAKPETVRFGDFLVSCVSREDLVAQCLSDLNSDLNRAKVVMDVNGHALSLARTSAEYREVITKADIIHADGGFLVTLSRFRFGRRIPERSATTDMIHDFASKFETTGHSMFLLGGTEDVNRRCAQVLQEMYPGLRIVGRRDGYFLDSQEASVVEEINLAQPDVLWVGLGKPKEQIFADRWKGDLRVTWIITCGGCYNYITGDYKRAPRWMQKTNLEWLHRMATNPRALFFRYFFTTPHALLIALGATWRLK